MTLEITFKLAVCGGCQERNAVAPVEAFDELLGMANDNKAEDAAQIHTMVGNVRWHDGKMRDAYITPGSSQGFNCGKCGHPNVVRQPAGSAELN